MDVNPLLRRAVCSATGLDVDPHGWRRPLCLSPHSGKPIVLEYDLDGVRRVLGGVGFDVSARRGIVRYEPLLPVRGLPIGYADDVGATPTLRHAALSEQLGVELLIKNEGRNPSGSFKNRGLAIGIGPGVASGARRFCLPTQGNAGVSAALFSTRLGLPSALCADAGEGAGATGTRGVVHVSRVARDCE